MARIIAEAGVRLRVDGKGLALEIRQVIRAAMAEAQATQVDLPSPTRRMADDADRDSNRIRRSLGSIGSALSDVAGRAASAALSGGKLLLIGTAAVGALAGVTQLALGVGALVGAAAQAAGVVGLLPAAFASLKASTAAIKLGLQGMSESMAAIASGDAAAFEESLKNLAPAAQDFARAVRDVKPAFDEMRLDVQQALFRDLADTVRPLADTFLPIASDAFKSIAGSANSAARETADFLLQGAQVEKVTTFSENLKASFANVAGALRPAVSALLDLTSTGSTFLPALTEQLNQWATGFSQRIAEAARSGELAAFFERSIEALRTLGRIAGNVFGAIGNILDAADTEAGGFLERIEEITQKFEDFTGSTEGQAAFGGFFESMRRVVDALGPAFFQLVAIIGRDFLPILADIASIIGPVLKPLFETFGRLLQSLRPLIAAIADAFATALEALGPFFDALATAINEAMPVLGPMIQDIGEAFANLFEAMVPLAPLFVELLEAILPIIPPFIQMIADLMPQFIEIIEALMPLIQALADAMVTLIPVFTDIASIILDVFIPVLEAVVAVFVAIVDAVTWVVNTLWTIISEVFWTIINFLGETWRDITEQVSEAWNAIGDFFSDGIDGVLAKINSFASDLWNKFKGMMSNVVSAVGDGVANVVRWFLDLPDKLLGALSGIGSWLWNSGRDLVLGMLNGIKAAVQRVIDAVKGMVNDAIGAAKNLLGIASPSKVFDEIGRQIGQGFAGGLDKSTGMVADAAAAMAQAAIDAAAITAPTVTLTNPTAEDLNAARAAGAEAPVIQQTNIMRPGTDVMQFSHLVLKRAYGGVLSGASTLGVRRNPVQAGVDDQWVTV